MFNFFIIFLVVCVGIYLLFNLSGKRAPKVFFAKPLLTANETQFFKMLQNALPSYTVLAQVSMGALLQVKVPRNESVLKYRGRFAQKIVDFVILDENCQVVTLIELDDKSHVKEKDLARDAMTAEAGYPTLRYLSTRKPSESQLLQDVKACRR